MLQADKEINQKSLLKNGIPKYSVYVVLFAAFMDILGLTIMIPLLPFWITALGAQEIIIGLAISLYSLMHLIFSPLWGKLSDSYGRKPILLLGLFGSSLSFFLLMLTAFFFNSVEMIIVSRILAGVFASATLPSAQAFISDTTENNSKERTKYLGLIGAMSGLGFALGPVIGSIFTKIGEMIPISSTGYWAPALIATILTFFNFLAGIKFLPEIPTGKVKKFDPNKIDEILRSERKSLGKTLLNPLILSAFMVYGILHLIFSILDSTLVIFGSSKINGFNELDAGIVFMLAGITMIITQGMLLQVFLRKISNNSLLLTGMFILSISYFLASFTNSLEYLMALAIPIALGFSLSFPTTLTMLTNQTDPENTGKILGINSSIGALMRVIGPILGTSLFMIQIEFPWLISTLVILLVFCILGLVFLRSNKFLDAKKYPQSTKS